MSKVQKPSNYANSCTVYRPDLTEEVSDSAAQCNSPHCSSSFQSNDPLRPK